MYRPSVKSILTPYIVHTVIHILYIVYCIIMLQLCAYNTAKLLPDSKAEGGRERGCTAVPLFSKTSCRARGRRAQNNTSSTYDFPPFPSNSLVRPSLTLPPSPYTSNSTLRCTCTCMYQLDVQRAQRIKDFKSGTLHGQHGTELTQEALVRLLACTIHMPSVYHTHAQCITCDTVGHCGVAIWPTALPYQQTLSLHSQGSSYMYTVVAASIATGIARCYLATFF